MEFLTDYKKKMNEYKAKYEESKREIEELQATASLLATEYQTAVGEMEFDRANKLIKQLRDVEDEIKVKQEIASVIKSKSLSCDPKEAAKIEKNFKKYLDKKRKEAATIESDLKKKHDEYVSMIKKINAHNQEIQRAVNVLVNVPHKFNESVWRPAYAPDITLKTKLIVNQKDLK